MTITPQHFSDRWRASGAAERASYQLFLSELGHLLAVEPPHPKQPSESANSYVFEKPVPLPHGTTGYIDLSKRGCFVLEAKQGSDKATDGAPLSAAAVKRIQARMLGTIRWNTSYPEYPNIL